MADTTDQIYYEKEPEIAPNHTGHAVKVFVIHMGVLLVVSILIGVFWNREIMWILGGSVSFFMVPWHGIAIRRAMQNDEDYWEERMRYNDDD